MLAILLLRKYRYNCRVWHGFCNYIRQRAISFSFLEVLWLILAERAPSPSGGPRAYGAGGDFFVRTCFSFSLALMTRGILQVLVEHSIVSIAPIFK